MGTGLGLKTQGDDRLAESAVSVELVTAKSRNDRTRQASNDSVQKRTHRFINVGYNQTYPLGRYLETSRTGEREESS